MRTLQSAYFIPFPEVCLYILIVFFAMYQLVDIFCLNPKHTQTNTDRTPINVSGVNYNSRDPVLLSVNEIITKPLEPSKYQIKAFCKLLFSQMIRDPAVRPHSICLL